MLEQKTILQLFPNWNTDAGGVMKWLQVYDVPWQAESAIPLDAAFIGHSGHKIATPLLLSMFSDSTPTEVTFKVFTNSIYMMFGVNWSKMFATMSFEYNPIENYAMLETMSDDKTVTEYGRTDKSTANASQAVYGFNSEAATDAGENTGDSSSTSSGSDTITKSYNLKRTGNIGVTTSQQMIQSERDLWVWNFYNDVVFPDLDKYLTQPIY